MKKQFVCMLMVLGGCSVDPISSVNSISSHEYQEVLDLEINVSEMFAISEDFYYVYFYLPSCAHCNSIKDFVIEYAINHRPTFWFVTPGSAKDLPVAPNLSINIGAKSIEEVYLNGYPTLMKLTDHQVSDVFQGKNQVSTALKI